MSDKRIVEVHHRKLLAGELVHVANVATTIEDDALALEYAWRWTNNVDGSWSRRDLPDNGDENPDVTVIAPLPVHAGPDPRAALVDGRRRVRHRRQAVQGRRVRV